MPPSAFTLSEPYRWVSQGLPPASPLLSVPLLRSGCLPFWTCLCSHYSSQEPRSTRTTSTSTSTSWLTLLAWLRPGRRYCQCREPVGSDQWPPWLWHRVGLWVQELSSLPSTGNVFTIVHKILKELSALRNCVASFPLGLASGMKLASASHTAAL